MVRVHQCRTFHCIAQYRILQRYHRILLPLYWHSRVHMHVHVSEMVLLQVAIHSHLVSLLLVLVHSIS